MQSVKFVQRQDTDKLDAVLAFMDIKSAAKAHNSENVIDGILVKTQYNEPIASGSGLAFCPFTGDCCFQGGRTSDF